MRGIGFDATCSLAVTDLDGQGVTVTEGSELGGYGERNIILWADHRAEQEAEEINATGSVVLDYVGGRMSVRVPCMLIPIRIRFLTLSRAVGDGNTQNLVAEETNEVGSVQSMSVL